MKTMKTKPSKAKTKGEAKSPALSIESPIELENNNNAYKDMPLFSQVMEKFSDIEIKFILLQLNSGNMMGRKITKSELADIEQAFILKVISCAPVAEYGSLLKNIIQTKLINQI
jgi:hypothetical protein